MILLAVAAPAALAFAPPADRPVRYEIVERRPGRGGESRYTLREEARFAPVAGGGYVLTLTATAYTVAAPPAQAAMLRATMAPILARPIRILLDRGGVPHGAADAAATWDAFVAGIRREAAAAPPADRAAIARAADGFAALPPAEREARLAENADYVLAPRLPPIAPGRTVAEGSTTVARLDDGADGTLRYRREALTSAGAEGRLSVVDEFVLAPGTGLVVRRARTMRLLPAGGGAGVPLGDSETRMVR